MNSEIRSPGGDVTTHQRRWRRLLSTVAVTMALTAGALTPVGLSTTGAQAAGADPSANATTTGPETVSAESLPVPQVDGVVWDQVVIGRTVYVGGEFTSARPFTAKRGVDESPRSNVLAYDLDTGELLPFAPVVNAAVETLAASPDGKRLYMGGYFTKVDDQTRYRIAAFDLPSEKLVSNFRPLVNTRVETLVATNDTLFAGGAFTSAAQQTGVVATARTAAAAFAASDATLLPWAPNMTKIGGKGKLAVLSMVISPSQDKIVLGGNFQTLNGSLNPGSLMGAVDATTGKTTLPWKINSTIPQRDLKKRVPSDRHDFAVYSLSSDGGYVYGSMGPGLFEGVFKARWSDGDLASSGWLADCHGDSYDAVAVGDIVYTASHAHDCGNLNSFGDYVPPAGWYRALAFTTATTQKVRKEDAGYLNYAGNPAPSVLHWYPNFNAGPKTLQGPWDITAADGYVLYGGEFSTLNGRGQEGLARFAPRAEAPNEVGPQLAGSEMNPTVTAWGGNAAKLEWGINYDWDDRALRYEVIRNGNVDKPVFTVRWDSDFWKWRKGTGKTTMHLPGARIETLRGVDYGLTPGETYTYQIRTVDPRGNATMSDPVSHTTGGTASTNEWTSYDKTVLQDQPSTYFPLNETGAVGNDWAGSNSLRTVGARGDGIEGLETSRSYALNGTTAWAATWTAETPPQVYSSELWFSTTTKKGGLLIGMGGARSTGGSIDRQVYMDNAGRVRSANYDGTLKELASQKSYNDGEWHHVVNTLGPDGLALYIDGERVATRSDATYAYRYQGKNAHWIVGAQALGNRAGKPSSNFFAGQIDNVGIYQRALDPATIERHYDARIAPANALPTAAFTSTTNALAASVDASGSTDADGSIASYAWDFGDGASGTGATASHTYAAAGAYTVTVTVTDDRGGSDTTSAIVTVEAGPTTIAADSFDRSSSNGWGGAELGGPWTVGGRAADVSADGLSGVIATPPGATRSMMLPEVSAAATDTTVSFTIAEEAIGAQYVSVVGRQVGSSSYSARAVVQPDGRLQVQLFQGGTQLGKTVGVGGYTAGETVTLRLQVLGTGTTSLNAKAWSTSVAEPAEWHATATDSTAALQTAGSVGLKVYSAASNPLTTVAFDDFRVVQPE
ncbi:PKD domain-containing protein [Labedella endophytica]|uniref:PKD domain-containing protein n=1 Tax=Labedella endophytica TaxID=1523160 RepID=A0A433JW56_9MICO|nr:PKD domain-containing protein [Labedella endophytica]RUR03380.1 PKD domain-containing protein [Labedella endophytica]